MVLYQPKTEEGFDSMTCQAAVFKGKTPKKHKLGSNPLHKNLGVFLKNYNIIIKLKKDFTILMKFGLLNLVIESLDIK